MILIKKRAWSFQARITLFLLIMLALESMLFVGFLLWGSVVPQFDKNAADVFAEQVDHRASYLRTDMVQRWSQLDWSQSTVNETVENYLDSHHLSAEDLTPGSPDTSALLAALAPDLISTLRRNSVNGVFIVLHGSSEFALPTEGSVSKSGLYIRDTDPNTDSESNADLFLKCGSYGMSSHLGLALDINWNPTFEVDQGSTWYFGPLLAVSHASYAIPNQLGYWAPLHAFPSGLDPECITYTQPLIAEDGTPYGVIGIELSQDYLRGQLPSNELPGEKEDAAYVLAFAEESCDDYHVVASTGALTTRLFGGNTAFRVVNDSTHPNLCQVPPLVEGVEEDVHAHIEEIELYDLNSDFENEHWYLVGMSRSAELFAYTNGVRRQTTILFFLALLLGAAISLVVGFYFSRPLKRLSVAIRNQDPNKPVELESTNIREVDELSSTVVTLSQEIAESFSRMNQIIDTVNVPIAVFQFNTELGQLSCSSRFYSILGLSPPKEPLTGAQFRTLMSNLHSHIEQDLGDGETWILRLPSQLSMGETRWVRLQRLYSGPYMMGILMDITDSQEQLARTEFERDHDPLTGLSNRLAFHKRVAEVSKLEAPGICAVMMMDLDNLKSVNDTYGHDYGDEYIRAAAGVLRRFSGEHCFPARISGDEFYILFSGYTDRQEVEAAIARLREELLSTEIRLPQGAQQRLRASAGVAWYPQDTKHIPDLIRYADFAMYQAKHSAKGSLRFFDIQSYNRDSVLVYDNAELDRIIETAAVDFVFQPIISCQDSTILGYEALMRPRSKVFSTPEEFLQIARMQSKLHHIEVLTWLQGSASFMALNDKAENARLFLNSIPSQRLTEEEVEEYNRRFPGLMGRTVLELLESDEDNTECTQRKLRRSKITGMMIALDDFGSGYSNESLLLNLHPHFVKIDRDVIREINTDLDRQTVFGNIAESCHSMGIQVIAEGVETLEQLRMVISLGADYIQGFYIARPAAQVKPIPQGVCDEIKAAWKEYRAGGSKA